MKYAVELIIHWSFNFVLWAVDNSSYFFHLSTGWSRAIASFFSVRPDRISDYKIRVLRKVDSYVQKKSTKKPKNKLMTERQSFINEWSLRSVFRLYLVLLTAQCKLCSNSLEQCITKQLLHEVFCALQNNERLGKCYIALDRLFVDKKTSFNWHGSLILTVSLSVDLDPHKVRRFLPSFSTNSCVPINSKQALLKISQRGKLQRNLYMYTMRENSTWTLTNGRRAWIKIHRKKIALQNGHSVMWVTSSRFNA